MIRQMFQYNNITPVECRRTTISRCMMHMCDQHKGVKYITYNKVPLSDSRGFGPAGWYWDSFLEPGYHGPFPSRYAAMIACVLSD